MGRRKFQGTSTEAILAETGARLLEVLGKTVISACFAIAHRSVKNTTGAEISWRTSKKTGELTFTMRDKEGSKILDDGGAVKKVRDVKLTAADFANEVTPARLIAREMLKQKLLNSKKAYSKATHEAIEKLSIEEDVDATDAYLDDILFGMVTNAKNNTVTLSNKFNSEVNDFFVARAAELAQTQTDVTTNVNKAAAGARADLAGLTGYTKGQFIKVATGVNQTAVKLSALEMYLAGHTSVNPSVINALRNDNMVTSKGEHIKDSSGLPDVLGNGNTTDSAHTDDGVPIAGGCHGPAEADVIC